MTKELREKLWSELLNYFEILDSKWRGMDWFLDCVEQEIIEAERRMKERCLAIIPDYTHHPQSEYIDWCRVVSDNIRTAISSLK